MSIETAFVAIHEYSCSTVFPKEKILRFCLTQKLAETSHLALFDSQMFKMKYIFRLNYTCNKLSDRIASQIAFPFEPILVLFFKNNVLIKRINNPVSS